MKHKLLTLGLILMPCGHIEADDTASVPKIEVTGIEYDYELYSPDFASWTDCRGTLTITANVSENTTKVLFWYSRSHLTPDDRNPLLGKAFYDVANPNEPVVITRPEKIHWGMYFKLGAVDENNNWVYTPIYCTSDFITPEDMEKILNNAGVDDIENDHDISLSFENNILKIDTSAETQLAVFDATGRILFNDTVNSYISIPLSSNFIIVRYSTNSQVFTKKLLSR